MRYVIMAAGEGKRWNNYLGIPKHLVVINGETLLERTVRLLKERGVTDIIITSSDERYNYALRQSQTDLDCEIDRFDEAVINGPICYLYGDVYYTEQAMDTIVNTSTDDYLFFGHLMEIFAIKIINIPLFLQHKHLIKALYLEGKIDRCIGWEVYRSLQNIPLKEHIIKDHYCKILDGTDDIDYPEDYENFKRRVESL